MYKKLLFCSIMAVARFIYADSLYYNPVNEYMVQMGYLGTGAIMCGQINNDPNVINGVQLEITKMMNMVSSMADTKVDISKDINAQLNTILFYCKSHPDSPLAMAFINVMAGIVGNFVKGSNTGNAYQGNYAPQQSLPNSILNQVGGGVYNTNQPNAGADSLPSYNVPNYDIRAKGSYDDKSQSDNLNKQTQGVGVINY